MTEGLELFLKVLYSCSMCGLTKVPCEVPVRKDGEDVAHWLNEVCITAIAKDHRTRSPWCRATKLDEVMIPISGADMVGGPPKQ